MGTLVVVVGTPVVVGGTPVVVGGTPVVVVDTLVVVRGTLVVVGGTLVVVGVTLVIVVVVVELIEGGSGLIIMDELDVTLIMDGVGESVAIEVKVEEGDEVLSIVGDGVIVTVSVTLGLKLVDINGMLVSVIIVSMGSMLEEDTTMLIVEVRLNISVSEDKSSDVGSSITDVVVDDIAKVMVEEGTEELSSVIEGSIEEVAVILVLIAVLEGAIKVIVSVKSISLILSTRL